MKKCCNEKHLLAINTLKISEKFHLSLKDLRLKLSELESKVMSDWIVCGLPHTCETDIIENEENFTELHHLKQELGILKSQLSDLKAYTTSSEEEMIDQWLWDLDQRMDDLDVAVNDKQVMYLFKYKAEVHSDITYLHCTAQVAHCVTISYSPACPPAWGCSKILITCVFYIMFVHTNA